MGKYGTIEESEAITRVWDGAKKIGLCMLVTWDGEHARARPVAAQAHREDGRFYILSDIHGRKDDQIERSPKVTLAFTDTSANTYISVTGRAAVSNDRAKIKDVWSVYYNAFWDGPDDPDVRLITVTPDDAEIWDGVGRLRGGLALALNATTGAELSLGDNQKVPHL